MIKKIALLAIVIGIFIAGNLIASERIWFEGYVDIQTSNSADVVIGYEDINGTTHPQIYWSDKPSGEYYFGFSVSTGAASPVTIYAEGTAPYGCYDSDECVANPNGTHYLELWLGIDPPGEEDPLE